ncbi:hypothetical protein [Sphingomonas sp. BK235]|jgi:Asp/Glu/hydantoin racemase|uniref:hypothetical protein n=1 Tax=Sphingomonas sp. BK235 TaxID=2512131 RepID=UPI00104B75F2|nr:hypothetical protein [Sphingomonas sp. BK235]TCP37063.1 hypothetical protein EV292_101570 [Sphingomonas sp. BK235]
MQTERVTFLTTPDHKAALDAFARAKGMSVGHVVREATSRYLLEVEMTEEEQAAFLLRELSEAVPRMRADIDAAIASIDRANAAVDAVLAGEEPRG